MNNKGEAHENAEADGIIEAMPTIPKDNTFFRTEKSKNLYVVWKGIKLEISNNKTVAKLGLDLSDVITVPDEALSLLVHGGFVS